MANRIIWYGERGVVNALVTDLASLGEGTVAAVQALLGAVCWCGGSPPGWVDEITGVTFLVELGMGQFGNPDLILACSTRSAPSPRVVFVESKVVPYLGSAMSNAGSMRVAGYNSSINGQLVLKHRLAHALCDWKGGSCLAEPQELHQAYRRLPDRQSPEAGGLHEPAESPRHLNKPSVLRLIRDYRLNGGEADRYHFVAWTWDHGPFFGTGGVSADLRPLFLARGDADALDDVWGRVGWLGYSQVQEQVQKHVGPAAAYGNAVCTMLRKLEPSSHDARREEGEPLTTINITQFGQALRGLLVQVEDMAGDHFGKECIERCNGSSSVKIERQVRVKIVPWEPGKDEHILLGIRSTLAPQDWCPAGSNFTERRLVGVGRNRLAFDFLRLPGSAPEALTVAGEVFQLLQDRFSSGD
jgi:hypothetical protein